MFQRLAKSKFFKSKSLLSFLRFAFCVFIAALIWLFLNLSKEYRLEFSQTIHYTNYPSAKTILSIPDSVVVLTFKIQGFNYLRLKAFNKDNTIDVDVTKLLTSDQLKHYNICIPSSQLKKYIVEHYDTYFNLETVKPDYFCFIFQEPPKVEVKEKIKIEKTRMLYTDTLSQVQPEDSIK